MWMPEHGKNTEKETSLVDRDERWRGGGGGKAPEECAASTCPVLPRMGSGLERLA